MKSVALAGGMIGAGLLYGDGIITSAIAVLSAIEGIEVATKTSASLVVPLTCSILILLFIFQHHGSALIGKIFGPVMILQPGWWSLARKFVFEESPFLTRLRIFCLLRAT